MRPGFYRRVDQDWREMLRVDRVLVDYGISVVRADVAVLAPTAFGWSVVEVGQRTLSELLWTECEAPR